MNLASKILALILLASLASCATWQSTRTLTYTGENGKTLTAVETTGVLSSNDSHITANYSLTVSADGSETLAIELGSQAVTGTENQATVLDRIVEAARYVLAAAIGYFAHGGVTP